METLLIDPFGDAHVNDNVRLTQLLSYQDEYLKIKTSI